MLTPVPLEQFGMAMIDQEALGILNVEEQKVWLCLSSQVLCLNGAC